MSKGGCSRRAGDSGGPPRKLAEAGSGTRATLSNAAGDTSLVTVEVSHELAPWWGRNPDGGGLEAERHGGCGE